MSPLLIVGIVGMIVLIVTVFIDDILDLDLGDGDILSVPMLAAGIGAFGFVSWAVVSTVGAALGFVAGTAAGIGSAWLTVRLMRAAVNLPTDATLSVQDYVGCRGKVIIPVPDAGNGEVLIRHAGVQHKLGASAREPLGAGEQIVVVRSVTPTSVEVARLDF